MNPAPTRRDETRGPRRSRAESPIPCRNWRVGRVLITTTEKCEQMDRGCVRSASRSGSAGGACVLGSFHNAWAFGRAAAGPSDTAAVRWQCPATQSLRATEEESNFACYLEDAPGARGAIRDGQYASQAFFYGTNRAR